LLFLLPIGYAFFPSTDTLWNLNFFIPSLFAIDSLLSHAAFIDATKSCLFMRLGSPYIDLFPQPPSSPRSGGVGRDYGVASLSDISLKIGLRFYTRTWLPSGGNEKRSGKAVSLQSPVRPPPPLFF